MKVLDFRLRPPTGGLLKSTFYSEGKAAWYAAKHGFQVTPAAQEKSMDLFWEECAAAGIVGGVMPARIDGGLYGGATNGEIAEIQRQYEGSLFGFGTVGSPTGAPLSEEEIVRTVDEAVLDLGLYGISLDPGFSGLPEPLDGRTVRVVAKRCGELGVPVLLTMAGLAGPTTEHTHPRYLDLLAASFPETKFIAAHGCWPHVQEACAVALARPNVFISADQGMMNTVGTSDYVAAINSFMADQFVFATSFPTGPLVDMVRLYEQLPIRDELRPRIMYENAARLLGL